MGCVIDDIILYEYITAITALSSHFAPSQSILYTSPIFYRQDMATEQRTNLNFLVRLGKSPSEALTMLQQVYGGETMSRSRVFEWHKRFKEGREEVEDDPRSGRPSTSRTDDNVERVRQMVRGDCRLTV